jgi:hypothetical protein
MAFKLLGDYHTMTRTQRLETSRLHSRDHLEVNMSEQELMQFFEFDQSDLQANQAGQISEKQKARVVKANRSRLFANPFAKFGYKLAVAQGPVSFESLQTSYHGGELWYYLEVEQKSFRVDKALLNIMTPGEVYNLYYCYADDAPDDNGLYKILSAELVSKAK